MIKIKKKKNLVILLSIFVLVIIITMVSRGFYINSKCKNPDTALKYLVKQNKDFKVKDIIAQELLFSSDDLLIYTIDTTTKKSFEYNEKYIITLKKESEKWTLYEMKIFTE